MFFVEIVESTSITKNAKNTPEEKAIIETWIIDEELKAIKKETKYYKLTNYGSK